MTAYSINLCDGGSVMNNSAITQRADGTSPWWPADRGSAAAGAPLLHPDTLTEEVRRRLVGAFGE